GHQFASGGTGVQSAAGRDVVGRVRGRGREDAASLRFDAREGVVVGERSRGMAVAKVEAAGGAGESFQLSRGVVERRRETADEDEVRRDFGGCTVQWDWHVAAESA